jgi:DNA-directed RNA polymerase specialized sigma24 family protein
MENYSHDRIAEALDMTVASSKWHLFEARRILKDKVSAYLNQNGQN